MGASGDVMPWLEGGRWRASRNGTVTIGEAGRMIEGRVYGFVGYCVWIGWWGLGRRTKALTEHLAGGPSFTPMLTASRHVVFIACSGRRQTL